MRIRRIILSICLLAAVGCSAPLADSAADCVAWWNRYGHHATVATEGYAVAEISAGENKAGQAGCGALFHSAPRRPWRVYGGVVEGDAVRRWDTQAGSSWTVDSPEGPIDATVCVRPDGTLAQT